MLSKLKILTKRSYVAFMHGLGALLGRIGVLGWLDRRVDRRGIHWLRSLFAIYDLDQMIALDVPWWTYPSIDRVDAFLKGRPGAKVFEYGSGASSVWLARRAASVLSVEHDKDWFDLMQDRIKDFENLSLTHVPVDASQSENSLYHSQKEGYEGQSFEAYANAISRTGQEYDVIVIDGRARVACLHVATAHLAEGGIIVFDNSKRTRYETAIRKTGLSSLALPGLTPSLPYPDKTTLLTAGGFEKNG